MKHLKKYFEEAINEAKKAEKIGEVPIGAIIVKDQKIIAKSHNQNIKLNDPTAHAEILAIRSACKYLNSKNLENCDLYVTLEPCQMCASAIANSRIRNLYFAIPDQKSGGVINGTKIFNSSSTHHKPNFYYGFFEEECKKIIQNFFKKLR